MTPVRAIARAVGEAGGAEAARACAVRIARARGLAPLPDAPAHRLAAALPELPYAALGGELVGRVYEALLPAARRRRVGAHYTPPAVADFLVARAWKGGRLLDPACGVGAFLGAAARRRGGDLARLEEVRGLELDPEAAALAVEALALETAADGIEVARRFWRQRVTVADALAAATGPMEAVVGNPPFFSALGRHDLQERARRRFPRVYTGRNDVSHFFVALALELLVPGGRLALVLPSYFLDNTFAGALRRVLAEEAGSAEVIDLRDARLFGAQVHVHAVLLVAERGAVGPERRLVAPRGARSASVLADLGALAEGRAPAILRPAPTAPDALLRRIAAAPPLAALCEIDKGCESGRNEVFALSEERAREHGLEAEALRPLVKGRHVTPFRIEPSGEVLLYLDGRTPLERWPRVADYLAPFREELCARADCREGRYPWWRLHRPRGPSLGSAPAKVVAPYRAREPAFAVDRRGALNDGGDVRFLVPLLGVDPDYLCGVLNSTVVRLWLAWRGKRKGRLHELFREPLARIPVPPPRGTGARRVTELAREAARRPLGVDERAEWEAAVAALYEVGAAEVCRALGESGS